MVFETVLDSILGRPRLWRLWPDLENRVSGKIGDYTLKFCRDKILAAGGQPCDQAVGMPTTWPQGWPPATQPLNIKI